MVRTTIPVLVAVMALFAYRIEQVFDISKQPVEPYRDGGCELVSPTGLVSSEDLTIYRDGLVCTCGYLRIDAVPTPPHHANEAPGNMV